MDQKATFQQITPLFLALLLVTVVVILALNLGDPLSIQFSPDRPVSQAGVANVAAFDYSRAADVSATRWQAMARFYEEHGMLTRDPFNYEQAAKNDAYRWQAMANFYEANGMLTRDPFDYEQAADNLAYRWEAMAKAYEQMGLLNDK